MNGQDIVILSKQLKAFQEVPISRYDEPCGGGVDAVYNPISELHER